MRVARGHYEMLTPSVMSHVLCKFDISFTSKVRGTPENSRGAPHNMPLVVFLWVSLPEQPTSVCTLLNPVEDRGEIQSKLLSSNWEAPYAGYTDVPYMSKTKPSFLFLASLCSSLSGKDKEGP